MADAHKNLAVSLVATAPSPAASGTSLVVTAAQGTRFPAVPFNATIWPASTQPDPTNAEIVRVTVISTDTLTITRAQESTSARTVVVGDQIAATITAKTLTDAESGGWTTVTKASDESVASSTVVQNDDELFFTATSGAHYDVELFIVYGSPAGAGTPELKFDLGEDATIRGSFIGEIIGASDTATAAQVPSNTTGGVVIPGTAAADRAFRLVGTHSGAGGTFRFRWAQGNSGVNATIVRAGSLIRYRRIV